MTAATRIDIEGELTIFSAGALRERLLECFAGGAAVEADLSRVSETDTAGVQLLLAAQREAQLRNLPLRFVAASAAVRDVLALCDLDDRLVMERRP